MPQYGLAPWGARGLTWITAHVSAPMRPLPSLDGAAITTAAGVATDTLNHALISLAARGERPRWSRGTNSSAGGQPDGEGGAQLRGAVS